MSEMMLLVLRMQLDCQRLTVALNGFDGWRELTPGMADACQDWLGEIDEHLAWIRKVFREELLATASTAEQRDGAGGAHGETAHDQR